MGAGDRATNGVVVVNAGGTFTYTPNANFNGADSFSYTITDADGDVSTATVSFNVGAVDDLPVALDDNPIGVTEDTPYSGNLAGNDTPSGDGGNVWALAAEATNGVVVVNAGGTFTYTPNANFNGADSFSYTITDADGDVSTATVSFNVGAINDAPVNTVPGAQSTNEDSTLVFSSGNGNGITVADVDNASLTTIVSVTNGVLTAVAFAGATITDNGTASVTISGTAAAINGALNGLSYAPVADYHGAATLTVSTTDGSTTDVDTVALTVTPVVDIAGDSVTTAEDTPITISVLANDSFENAGRTITAVDGSAIVAGGPPVAVANGTVDLNLSGQLTYTPTANYNGATSFTYTVSSAGVTETATVNVTVTSVNDLPVGRNATLTTAEDTPFVFGLANFLMNDVEDGTDANPNAVRIDTLPSTGSLYLNGVLVTPGQIVTAAQISAGQLSFIPNLNDSGTNYATLTFSVRDADGGFDTTPNTLTFNVTPVNDGAPLAGNDAFLTTLGTPIIISASQLLSNDALPDHAAITNVSAVSSGTLVNNGNGTYTFTPAAVGNATFSYTLTDDDGQTSVATVTINTVNASSDLATVYESALPTGTGAGSTTASGNLFTNDGGGTSITSVNGITDGAAGDTDSRAGYIGVTTTLGRLVVDRTGAGAGDYTYTLLNNADNSAPANDLSVTEVFNYVSNVTSAALRVTVVDDKPSAYDRVVQVSEDVVPSYNLVLVLDVSGSMTTSTSGGAVRQVNDDGSTTITTRLDLAKQGLVGLVEEYFNQAQNVSIKLITFSNSATILNGGAAYTDKASVIAAIMGITGTGGTNYEAALNAVQTAFGTVDPSVQNTVYFLSDSEPSAGNTTDPVGVTGYGTFVTNNNIDSYGVGIGTGIANPLHLNNVHNVDGDGDGVRDPAIIVPDLNQLDSALISTVPPAFGGNVVSGDSTGNVLGADGGYVQTMTVMLDSDGSGTSDQTVTFTYNQGTNEITQNSSFLTGYPMTGDLLTLDAASGFTLGTLTFNFSTGAYTYFTNGLAVEGDNFTMQFVARDGDGDVTPPTTLTFQIADGQPLARPDTDTLLPNQTHLEGNVISGLGTDGGLALGNQVTSFSPQGSGVDMAVDGAQVSSVTFQGQTYSLLANSSGSGAGYSYTVTSGQLAWTGTDGSSLVFNRTGYYDYTPPTAAVPVTPTTGPFTTLFNTAANADDNGVVLSGLSRTATAQTVNHSNPGGTSSDGAGVNGGPNDFGVNENLDCR